MKDKLLRSIFVFLAAVMLVGCGASEPDGDFREDGAGVEQEAEAFSPEASPIDEAAAAEDMNRQGKELPEEEKTGQETFLEGRVAVGDLPGGDLPRPAEELTSLDDFVYLLDYMAFYRVPEMVYVGFEDSYAETFYNPYQEYQKAYRMADLADVYACRLDDSYYSQYGYVGIRYSMSRDIASNPAAERETAVLPGFEQKICDGDEAAVLPIDEGEMPEIGCENGEQLYYIVMHGMRPKPEPGSMAECLYKEARSVIAGCVPDGADDFRKIKAIYDYLTTEVLYDSETAYSQETYLVAEQAYYLEGVFLNHCAVCDGKAKACALLLNMLGVPCWRTTGVNEGGDHAWNMVQLDGNWYQLCTTYGQADLSDEIGCAVPNCSMLLAGAATPYEWYPAQKHPDVEEQLSKKTYPVFERIGEEAGVNLAIESAEELAPFAEKVRQICKMPCKAEFIYTGAEKEKFAEELADFVSTLPNANAMEVKSDRGTVYEILFLDNAAETEN